VSEAPSRDCGLVCAVCSQNLLQQLEVLIICTYCTSSLVGPYTFEGWIQKVAVDFPNIIEGIVGSQLCMLFLLQICLTAANTTIGSDIFHAMRWYYDKILFQSHSYTYTYSASASPRSQACVTRPSLLVGGVWTETGRGVILTLEWTLIYWMLNDSICRLFDHGSVKTRSHRQSVHWVLHTAKCYIHAHPF